MNVYLTHEECLTIAHYNAAGYIFATEVREWLKSKQYVSFSTSPLGYVFIFEDEEDAILFRLKFL
jgi:hypothetical protein